jgi:hypothetical protein
MKIEQWNLLKLFHEGGKGITENDGLRYIASIYVNVTMNTNIKLKGNVQMIPKIR